MVVLATLGRPLAADASEDGRFIRLECDTDAGPVQVEFVEAHLQDAIEKLLRASRSAAEIRRRNGERQPSMDKWPGAALPVFGIAMGTRERDHHLLLLDTGGTRLGFQMTTDQVSTLRDQAESKAPKSDPPPPGTKH
jgi:hypothetical protein